MKRTFFVLFALVLVSATAASGSRDRVQARHDTDPNAVLYWSQVAESTISVGRPPASSEVLNGLVHAAIYDTIVSVEGEYEPFAVSIRRTGRPRSTLPLLRRRVECSWCGCRARPRSSSPLTRASSRGFRKVTAKTNGIRLGRAVAGAYIALRSDDGFDNVVQWVQPTPGPGVFEPIPSTVLRSTSSSSRFARSPSTIRRGSGPAARTR